MRRSRLEVARALALDPRILLLDEVMAGLNPAEVTGMVDLVETLHQGGLTILVIEHRGLYRQGPRMTALLSVQALDAGYGDLPVLHGVSLHVDAGEIVAIVGANGAGKSTLLSAIVGLLRPSARQVGFQGTDITGARPIAAPVRVGTGARRRPAIPVPDGRGQPVARRLCGP